MRLGSRNNGSPRRLSRPAALVVALLLWLVAGQVLASASIPTPCTAPISWRVGAVDPRFGLSTERFEAKAQAAAEHWNEAAGRPVLVQDEARGFPVHLRHDWRQERAQEIADLASDLNELQARLEAKSEALRRQDREIDAGNAAYERRLRDYGSDVEAFNAAVSRHNRGASDAPESASLRREEARLNQSRSELRALDTRLARLEEIRNATVREHNALADEINSYVARINRAVATMPPEAGAYRGRQRLDRHGRILGVEREISIYFYYREHDLELFLAHEFGHALGLGHVADPEAVMHAANTIVDFSEVRPLQLMPADIAALQALCEG